MFELGELQRQMEILAQFLFLPYKYISYKYKSCQKPPSPT